ncbi:hypothetical protein FKR81_15200 [Lentzea tibetensis]|uniref:Uncharacterized protein n=1 Tax=Lentzea tibetensis TaxID=2591470 RepID=A0A563EVM9_9PSEU|nr:hypothetical protein [Lentzea tibetensis]TWP51541.1 hypothetical protein FKR81_15200 [Lentzea tibetensis]
MRKTLLGALVPVAAIAGMLGAGTAQADDAPNQAPTLDALNDQWNNGGGAIGYGAASMVSAAWLGIPSSAVFYGQDVTGLGDVEYVPAEG